ncbi:sodium:solute symporter family protein [Desulfogranum japonicum]|uniref:sodium:solute symporter family protein n=1 Tax=Desulfogranum japonicum TaxID=231447 RepID=UPI00042016C4|nr:sodium:solute symporter family protein [Desulfogranum japonicum]
MPYIYQITFILTFLGISILSVRRSAKVQSADEFSVASRSLAAPGVSWVIIGTLVGGVSTIGTVQTAYTHGISAGIFTFGSGLSCFVLGCFFARALREEGVVTVSEYLGRFFGQRFRRYCSAINSMGMFIHVVGQFLASIAILQAVFHFGDVASVLITMCLIGVFVLSGGIAGAGLIGKIKFFMLYLIMLTCAGVALSKGGGMEGIISRLPVGIDMLGFSHYGIKTAVLDMFSMLVGVLSTQIYLQAIFSARDVRAARNGAFLSAIIIPPVGVLGIIVGLYLRANHPEVAASPAQALPYFLEQYFPPLLAAFFSAGILLIVLGTGAGLVLGVTTNLYNDFICQGRVFENKTRSVTIVRASALLVLLSASLLVFTGLDSTILKWSYMSMGLRGAAVFAGLCVLVFCQKLASSRLVLFLLYLLPVMYIVLQIL